MEYKKPKRFFEKSGVVNPDISYYVPMKVVNTDNMDVKTMVDMGRYFSIFAPRQSGKTTFFEMFCHGLEKDNAYIAILLSFQDCKSLDVKQFYNSIEIELYAQLIKRLKDVHCDKLEIVNKFLKLQKLTDHLAFKSLFIRLNEIIEQKKIVIIIDEFDGIPSSELENFLCVLRELYQKYKKIKQKALYSIGVVGIRNITKLVVGGVSPFNIADKVKIPPFNLKNVKDLYAQYAEETNQPFTEEAVQMVFDETNGQPWLVNRIGTILTVDVKPKTIDAITADDVCKAIGRLLKEGNSHFDNLVEKAKQHKESFVEIVFNGVEYDPDSEDQSLLELHGLIRDDNDKAIVTNKIYKKRFVRMFFREVSRHVEITGKRYYQEDGSLNMESVLREFEKYIACIGVRAFYEKGKPYEKTGQFLLTAWLYQFVSDSDNDLRYECPTGLGRMDILLTFNGRKYIIETKINRYKGVLDEAVTQLKDKYLMTEMVDEGYVVIFDSETLAGNLCVPEMIEISESRQILFFNIGIGRKLNVEI